MNKKIRSGFIKELTKNSEKLSEALHESSQNIVKSLFEDALNSSISNMVNSEEDEEEQEEMEETHSDEPKSDFDDVEVIDIESETEGLETVEDENEDESIDDLYDFIDSETGEIDLTGADDEQVMRVLKVMKPEDGIRVLQNQKGDLEVNVDDVEYVIELDSDEDSTDIMENIILDKPQSLVNKDKKRLKRDTPFDEKPSKNQNDDIEYLIELELNEDITHRDDYVRQIVLTYENTRDLYVKGEWCAKAMVKKAKRGEEPTLEHLADSTTVKTIVRGALQEFNKSVDKEDMLRPSSSQRKEMHLGVAESIFEIYQGLLEDNNELNEDADLVNEITSVTTNGPQARGVAKTHGTNNLSRPVPRNGSVAGVKRKSTSDAMYSEEDAKLRTEAKRLSEEYNKLKKASNSLLKKLNEAVVVNSALSHTVKLVLENSTTLDEKKYIVKTFDKAKSVEDTQRIYESLSREFNSKVNKTQKPSIKNKVQIAETKNKKNDKLINESVNPIKDFMKRLDMIK